MDIEQIDLEKLDKIFPYLHEYGKFNITNVLPDNIQFDDGGGNGLLIPAEFRVQELLKKYGYATIIEEANEQLTNFSYTSYFAELTTKGREAKNFGGHFVYLKESIKKVQNEEERRRKEDEISKYDLLQKKYFYKSRYAPHIFSGLALIGTAISLYFSYKALYKQEPASTHQPTQLKKKDQTPLPIDTSSKAKPQ